MRTGKLLRLHRSLLRSIHVLGAGKPGHVPVPALLNGSARGRFESYDPVLYDLIGELLPLDVSWEDCYRDG